MQMTDFVPALPVMEEKLRTHATLLCRHRLSDLLHTWPLKEVLT